MFVWLKTLKRYMKYASDLDYVEPLIWEFFDDKLRTEISRLNSLLKKAVADPSRDELQFILRTGVEYSLIRNFLKIDLEVKGYIVQINEHGHLIISWTASFNKVMSEIACKDFYKAPPKSSEGYV